MSNDSRVIAGGCAPRDALFAGTAAWPGPGPRGRLRWPARELAGEQPRVVRRAGRRPRVTDGATRRAPAWIIPGDAIYGF